MKIELSDTDFEKLAVLVSRRVENSIITNSTQKSYYDSSVNRAYDIAKDLFDPRFITLDAVEKCFEEQMNKFSKDAISDIINKTINIKLQSENINDLLDKKIYDKLARMKSIWDDEE